MRALNMLQCVSNYYYYYYYYYYNITITVQPYNFVSLKVVSFAAARAGVMQAPCSQRGVRRWTWGQYSARKQGLDLVLGNCSCAQMREWVLEKRLCSH